MSSNFIPAGGPSGISSETDPIVGAVNGIVKANGAGSISAAVADTDYQDVLAEGAFVDGDKTKLDGIEASADVTDTANVTAAGALMDSEVTDLAGIKSVTISDLQPKPSEGAFADGDKTKLDAIEASADVTDETNVVSSLDGATLPVATVAGADKVLVQDADAADALKTVTAQSIADLGGGGGGGTAQGVDGTYDIQPADEGVTAGNARGENSVDLCTKRSNVAYVCAGANSGSLAGENVGGTGTHTAYLAGLNNHTNSGNHCSISGQSNNSNSGNHCLISGQTNFSNSGNHCLISGQTNFSNSGNHCSISGSGNYMNSGSFCQISGNFNYSNTGSYCSISGQSNGSNTGSYCLISGQSITSNSGTHCSISGYYHHSNTGNYCSISGANASNNNLDYARVHGGGYNARIIDLVAKASTTDATPKAITLGGASEGASGSIIIPADTAWAFVVHVVAVDVTNGFANSKKFSFDGLCLNDGGTVTVSSATLGTDATQGTFTGSVALSADTTNDALRIVATGIAATTVRWTARVELTQVD